MSRALSLTGRDLAAALTGSLTAAVDAQIARRAAELSGEIESLLEDGDVAVRRRGAGRYDLVVGGGRSGRREGGGGGGGRPRTGSMTHPAFALQQAVVAALAGDAGLAALVADRIHDSPPRASAFPYVAVGEIVAADWSGGSDEGAELRLLLHLWSRGGGKAETLAIAAAIEPLLHDQALGLSGHRLVNLRHQRTTIGQDPDGRTWHGTMRFRAVTEPA